MAPPHPPTCRQRLALQLGLLSVPLGLAGSQIFTKLALNTGISRFVFPVYRNALALAVVAPLAFFLEKKQRTALSRSLVSQLFLLGFIGIFCNQLVFLAGLAFTSPTLSATTPNAAPAFTYLLAIIFRLETVDFKRRDVQAKLLGTLLSVSGAVVVTLYQGPTVIRLKTSESKDILNLRMLLSSSLPLPVHFESSSRTWQIGALCLIGGCITWSIFLTFQAPILKKFPAPLSVAASANFFGMVLHLVVGAICERDPSKWALAWGPQIVGIAYAGLVISGLVLSVQAWCIKKGGPVLAAVYEPVETISVAILSCIFLRDPLYLGSIVGGIVIISGLYLVAWGQAEQQKRTQNYMLEVMDGQSRQH